MFLHNLYFASACVKLVTWQDNRKTGKDCVKAQRLKDPKQIYCLISIRKNDERIRMLNSTTLPGTNLLIIILSPKTQEYV